MLVRVFVCYFVGICVCVVACLLNGVFACSVVCPLVCLCADVVVFLAV